MLFFFQLQDITDSDPIPKDFALKLIEKKRVLVIIDHLSEMNSKSRDAIITELSKLKIRAVIVTSRTEEPLGGVTKTVVKPLRIAGEGIVIFIAAYLRTMGKRDLFNNTEFLEACHNFSTMIGESPLIFAKFFAEQLIVHKQHTNISEMPKNIPDLMLSYLNEINRNVPEEDKVENRFIHSDAKILAWEAIKDSFVPSPIKVENATSALGGEDADRRLHYLEHRLILIETTEISNDKVRFLLDPLAEYLAALYVIEDLKDNESRWRTLLTRMITEKIEKNFETNGFFNALYECVLLKEMIYRVPGFAITQLGDLQ